MVSLTYAVSCLIQAISNDVTGEFNVAGDGAVTITEFGRLLGKKVIRLPAGVVKNELFVLKRLNMTQYGEEQINFLRYRPVLDNARLKQGSDLRRLILRGRRLSASLRRTGQLNRKIREKLLLFPDFLVFV